MRAGARRSSPVMRSPASRNGPRSSAPKSASHGRTAAPDPSEALQEDRARVARLSAPPPRDQDGAFRMRLKRLAAERGVEPGPLIEEWRERSWAYECAGTASHERLACEHIEERLCR